MVGRAQRRYRKASDEFSSANRSYIAADDRKAYAGKVRSLIERKHRCPRTHSAARRKPTTALRNVLSKYPKGYFYDGGSVSSCSNSSCEFLDEVYESQKLNFRRMISNLSRGAYETAHEWGGDADSWTDLESNFSLIYEPSYAERFLHDDVNDVILTLEKVKNLKNNNNNNSWDNNSSCDYCYRFTPESSDTESFLSSCSSCLRNYYSKNNINNNNYRTTTNEKISYRDVTPRLSRRDSWTNSEMSDSYEPVSAEHVIWTSRIKQLKKKLRSSDSAAKVRRQFDDKRIDRFTPTPLAIDCKERKMKELIEKLKEDLDSDWDSNASVSLGLIYIPPMDESKKKQQALGRANSTVQTSPINGYDSPVVSEISVLNVEESNNSEEDDEEETLSGGQNEDDPLGSLESLIFEPKDAEDTSSFPQSIGRNSCLKASISVSNVTRSGSQESLSTVIEDDQSDKTVKDNECGKETLVLGNYWDWKAGNEQQKAAEGSTSGPLSDCKTCAGETSVMSWTYIGRQNNLANVVKCDRPATVAEQKVGNVKKKEVTWKMIGESRKAAAAAASSMTTLSDSRSAENGMWNGENRGTVADVCLSLTSENLAARSNLTSLPLVDAYNSWSDLEYTLFPEENEGISASTQCKMFSNANKQQKSNRMNCYRDDWLWWDQQRKTREASLVNKRSDVTWRTKAKRMFLWMHLSQGSPGSLTMERWTWWKAKQRVSILWLISKANNNKVPDDLKEPYYRDHDNQDQLKPVIIHALATAEYYCLALGNIYADPNYHNLNHWGVIQALARKGVYVAEPSDVSLTETVLLQTSPIRMSAHMAVIEAIMALYLKETITVERIVQAVKRFIPSGGPIELPADIEDALVFWINKVCVRMKHRIEEEMGIATSEVQKDANAQEIKTVEADNKSNNMADKVAPPLSLLRDLSDLSDGCCLAALISYYCPVIFRWQAICLNSPMSMADSLYNLQLVQKFCKDQLSYDPCFLTLEDMVYQHSSVTQNILVFLAELFYMFEIRPSKCVGSASKQDVTSEIRAAGLPNRNGHNEGGLISSATKRSFQQPVSPIPDLRTSISNSYFTSVPDLNRISPKGNGPQIREPLLPRRQNSQHERMQERNKRFSFNEGPKGVSPSIQGNTSNNSMRRSHSVQEMDKNGAIDKHYTENEAESAYYSTSPVARKVADEPVVYESTSELYLRPLPSGDCDQLMPAVIKPQKEKSNKESKPEEMGEYPSGRVSKSANSRDSVPKDNGYHVTRQQQPTEKLNTYNLKAAPNNDNDIPTYVEIKSDGRFDYLDNRQLEESLSKQPFILSSNEGLLLKEGLESLGSNESGVFLEHLPKKDLSTTSFAQLSKLRENHKGINIIYMQHERSGLGNGGGGGGKYPAKSSFLQKSKNESSSKGERKTSFADLPNQTTWQQHQMNNSTHETNQSTTQEAPLVSQLADIRLKLEEKRRHIESEKRQMDMMMGRERQQMGKTAFLQVVSRGKGTGKRGVEDESLDVSGSSGSEGEQRNNDTHEIITKQSNDGEKNYEEYNRSIEHLASSLSDLQTDIQRLTFQQDKIQQLMHNGMPHQPIELSNQFYLHEQSMPQQPPMWSNRSPQQEYMYAPSQTMPRSQSREQLYQPLQRSQSREHLLGPQMHWGNEPMQYPPHMYQPQPAYMDQQGFQLHSQPHFIPMYANNSMLPPSDSYGGNYGPYQSMPIMAMDSHQHQRGPNTSPQIHMDVPTASHSQSPMTYHRSPQPPRPPSRPSSAPANSGQVVSGSSLPVKAQPVMAPLEVCMEPQSVHFIDTSDCVDDTHRTNQEVEEVMANMSGGSPTSLEQMSGTATYRVREPLSPTRPVLGKTFRVPKTKLTSPPPREGGGGIVKSFESESATVDKGFFVSFDDEGQQPRKPKPLMQSSAKKMVPKIMPKPDTVAHHQPYQIPAPISPIKRVERNSLPLVSKMNDQIYSEPNSQASFLSNTDQDIQEIEENFRTVISDAEKSLTPSSKDSSSVGFLVATTDESFDSEETGEDEMARRKERILLSVLKRKEQQEIVRARKEQEAAKRREQERRKQEAIDRKKEEDRERRNAILEQYRQRKAAMEEQEGDRDSSRTATLTKPKVKPGLKPRPKSLHESALSGQEDRQTERMMRATGGRGSQSNIASKSNENGSEFKYGRATPPRRAPSPGQNSYDRHHPPSPISYQCLPGGLPPGLVSRRPVGPGAMMFNDAASDSCSTASSTAIEYTGPKLFKQPTAKSNRGIIINAINTVLAGAVNNDLKRHVLEEIAQSESKHFLILFRDAGCQFRALYSYSPEREEVIKMYGTGPRQVNERMINKFYKYNCGGRNFTDIQTKHLTVTIDAFTIHNTLWQGKKVVPGRKEL